MINELSKEDFLFTMQGGMLDVSEDAEPVTDIWPYANELQTAGILNKIVYERELVEKVYRNKAQTYDHVMMPTPDANFFVIVIVDLHRESVFGHYTLDLNKEY